MSTIIQMPRAKSRRRGRPAVNREEKDLGTPELQKKREDCATAEALDLCLEKRLITPEQHWCGIHLRWLYTLRHGVPNVRAIDPNHVNGLDLEADDPCWRSAREAEYHEAVQLLSERGLAVLVASICIYNERPTFLQPSKKIVLLHDNSLEKFCEGLDILVNHWQIS